MKTASLESTSQPGRAGFDLASADKPAGGSTSPPPPPADKRKFFRQW
jgi:hypothetical protein